MPDLLVPLYRLPARSEGAEGNFDDNLLIRRANPFEITRVSSFIAKEFSQSWADEAAVAFSRQPITCFLALHEGQIVGFAVYESTRRAYFGPTGVDTKFRKRGLGRRLLIASLWGLWDLGYAYGIIGSAGPVDFYIQTVGAIVIPESTPGIYTDMLA